MTDVRYVRRVIKITALHSPNVRLALEQKARGLTPTGEVVCPGVLTWDEYLTRRATWDGPRQCVGLDAEFYEGAELLLFPTLWLNRAEEVARLRTQLFPRRWMGVDPAEGRDRSVWSVVDRLGLVYQLSMKTPDTNVIPGQTVALMTKYNVKDEDVCFDRGGGKTHADRLRAMGRDVRTVGFGAAVAVEPKRGITLFDTRREVNEAKYEYLDRRAQMYGELSELMDPTYNPAGFGIPAEYAELRRQLGVIPRWTDDEGRMYLPSKKKKDDDPKNVASKKKTLIDLCGHSPDEADSLVLAVHAMLHRPARAKAGVMT